MPADLVSDSSDLVRLVDVESSSWRPCGSIDDAAAELRTLAGGRGELLAETAGVMAGAWTARIDTGDHLLAAGLLVLAGADHDLIAHWVDVGRQRATAPRHSI